jgi:hypothetical protein
MQKGLGPSQALAVSTRRYRRRGRELRRPPVAANSRERAAASSGVAFGAPVSTQSPAAQRNVVVSWSRASNGGSGAYSSRVSSAELSTFLARTAVVCPYCGIGPARVMSLIKLRAPQFPPEHAATNSIRRGDMPRSICQADTTGVECRLARSRRSAHAGVQRSGRGRTPAIGRPFPADGSGRECGRRRHPTRSRHP